MGAIMHGRRRQNTHTIANGTTIPLDFAATARLRCPNVKAVWFKTDNEPQCDRLAREGGCANAKG